VIDATADDTSVEAEQTNSPRRKARCRRLRGRRHIRHKRSDYEVQREINDQIVRELRYDEAARTAMRANRSEESERIATHIERAEQALLGIVELSVQD
jgi:hypothetical protein